MKKFIIDPSGGMAGDMFSAALISAGANESLLFEGMISAAKKIGEGEISLHTTDDGSKQLKIHLQSNHKHLKGSDAEKLLDELFNEFNIEEKYRKFGFKALQVLIDAERKAHSENLFESDHYHILPIGMVRSPYTNHAPYRPDNDAKGNFFLEIFSKYEEGLANLNEFSHVYVIAYLTKSIGYSLKVNPPGHDLEVGLFASRSPFRPNPIGLNIAKILKIERNKVFISPVDFLDKTPIIDIKPVIQSLDGVNEANNGWIKNQTAMIDLNTNNNHSHYHNHNHQHNEAFLHEAQDIIIDIIGAVIGMQSLNLETNAVLLKPVSVGGGIVNFSHGKLSVPSPATKNILEKYNIPYKKGPIDVELCTPTGSAILAALDVKVNEDINPVSFSGFSRGTKILPVPPLKVAIVNV